MEYHNPTVEKHSERVFWVIQTIFGFIIGRSFYAQASLFIPPFHQDLVTITLAIISVYVCVMWSWVDFSFTLIKSPYHFGRKKNEIFRFLSDLTIVGLYSYLVIDLEKVGKLTSGYYPEFFITFALIFLMYIVSGALRILEYGPKASHIGILAFFFHVYLAIALLYIFLFKKDILSPIILNRTFIFSSLLITGIFRTIRALRSKRKYAIAVDLDGVLANQISPLLPIIKSEYDVDLEYKDIVEWDLKIADTDIAKLIVGQQQKQGFTLNLPVIEGAIKEIHSLIKRYHINIVTARDPSIDTWSIAWLNNNCIEFDAFDNAKEGYKQDAKTKSHILIDDYQKNIAQFLQNSKGKAILFGQPWNSDHKDIQKYIDNGRLVVVCKWGQIPNAIKQLGY